jgi:hypothetical protein
MAAYAARTVSKRTPSPASLCQPVVRHGVERLLLDRMGPGTTRETQPKVSGGVERRERFKTPRQSAPLLVFPQFGEPASRAKTD